MDIYGGRDPREIPNYTVSEAARLLESSQGAIRKWIAGREYTTHQGPAQSAPLLDVEGPPWFLTFNNLIELQVLEALRREPGIKVSLQKVRKALAYMQEKMGVERPLLTERFSVDKNCNLFIDHYGHLLEVSASGQVALKAVLAQYLKTIDYDKDGLAKQWRPLLYGDLVVVNPRISFGRPTLKGTRTPLDSITDQFKAGDGVEELAYDFSYSPEKLEDVLRHVFRKPAKGADSKPEQSEIAREWLEGHSIKRIAETLKRSPEDIQGIILEVRQAA